MSDPRMRRAITHYGRAAERYMARTMRGRAAPRPLVAGRGDTRIGIPGLRAATINVDALRRGVLGVAPGLRVRDAPTELLEAAANDVKTLATAPFVGGYEIGASAVEAAQGDLSRGRRLASGAWEGIKASVPGQLAQGDIEGAITAAREHPLLAALDVSAVGAVAGRTAGATLRGVGSRPSAGGVRGRAARAGSTVRPPISMTDDPGAPVLVERRGSKDTIRRSAQAAADARREPLRDAQGNVVMVTQRGRKVPVLRASPRERARHSRREADFAASRANSVERMVRDQAGREMKVRGVRGRAAKDLVSMVVEGTITSARHFEADLRAHRDKLAARIREHEQRVKAGEEPIYRHSDELEAAKSRLALVEKVLASPKAMAQASKIVAAGEAIGRRLNEVEREAIGTGLLAPGRARRSKLVPAAVEHLGARYFREPELRALERSGTPVREPQALARHEEARSKVATAEGAHRDAAKALEALKQKRSRLVGAQSSRRGRRQSEGKGGAATTAERRKLEAVNREIKEARATVAERLKERRRAERVLARTPKPPIREALRGPDGRFLSNDEVEQFLRDRGRDPESVAYLPHRLDTRGRRAFHTQFRPGARGTMDTAEARTGSAYAKGVTESSAKLIQEQGVRQRTQLNKAKQLDRMISDQGILRPDGRHFTATEALEAAQRLEADTGERLVPVRAFAAKLNPETQRIIREDLQGPGAMETLHLRLLNDRVVTSPDAKGGARARNVVLVKQEYIDRLTRHLQPAGSIQKFLQMLNRPFRFAVLAQPRWLVGNFVEPFVVRLTVNGSGLNVFGLGVDIRAVNRVLKRMERSGDPKMRAAAEELRGQQLGGLFIGGRGATVRRSADEIPMYGELVSKLPAIRQGAEVLRMVGHALMAPAGAYFRLNRAIENVAQRASLGRDVRRDLQEFRGSWLATWRLQEKAVEEAARGLVNTSTQRRFMRSQHETLGKYEGFSPWMRELVQGAMPFLPWALNAARFTMWTMPAHHTALTAMLVKVNDVVAKDWEEIHRNVPPGGLRLAIPTAKGGWIDLARYTPYGLPGPIAMGVEEAPKQALQGVTDQFLPQLSSSYAAIQGDDPFGRELQVDPSEREGRSDPTFLEQVGIAAYSLGEAMTPYVAQARRIREGGGTAYGGSTLWDPDVKPGTDHMSGLRRTFDPFRPTYLRAPMGGAGGAPKSEGSRLQQALERRAAALGRSTAAQSRLEDALERRSRLGAP